MKQKNLKTAGALAALLLGAVLIAVVLVLTASAKPVIIGAVSDPDDTVEQFFDGLCAGEYEKCDQLLYGYSSLGLDSEPQTDIGAVLLDAVTDSLSWESRSECTVDGLEAECEVDITHIDTQALAEAVREQAGRKLELFASEAVSNDELYNEDGSYREDVIMRLLAQALDDTLASGTDYRITTSIRVSLHYIGGQWRIELSDELIAAVTGNLVSQGAAA